MATCTCTHTHTHTHQKEKVTLTLLRLSQLQSNDTVSLPIELPFLLPDSMRAMCRVSSEFKQSNVCYGRNLTCDRQTVHRGVTARPCSMGQVIAIYSIPQSPTFLEGYPTHFEHSLYYSSARCCKWERKCATEVTILNG